MRVKGSAPTYVACICTLTPLRLWWFRGKFTSISSLSVRWRRCDAHNFRSVTFFGLKPDDFVAPPPWGCIALILDSSVQIIKLHPRGAHPPHWMLEICEAGSIINFLPHLPGTDDLEFSFWTEQNYVDICQLNYFIPCFNQTFPATTEPQKLNSFVHSCFSFFCLMTALFQILFWHTRKQQHSLYVCNKVLHESSTAQSLAWNMCFQTFFKQM